MAHPLIEAWFKTAAGKGLDPDRAYGWQCVDAADHYAEAIFPGVSWRDSLGAVPGARSLMDTASTKYFTKIWNDGSVGLIPKRGDILIYEGWTANKWGHVGIVASATNSRVTLLQQDGFAPPYQYVNDNWYSKKPAHYATYGYALGPSGTGLVRGWLRPKLGTTVAPAASVKPAATKPKPTPAKTPADPLEEIMAYYKNKQEFREDLAYLIKKYTVRATFRDMFDKRDTNVAQALRAIEKITRETREIAEASAKKAGLTTAEIAAAAERGAAKGAAEALADGVDIDVTINGKEIK